MVKMIRSGVAPIDTRTTQPMEKKVDPFYLTPDWRQLVCILVARRGRRCEDPTCKNPDCTGRAIYGDHIQELKDGGAPLDPSNVLLRCASCHTFKTVRERARRMADTI